MFATEKLPEQVTRFTLFMRIHSNERLENIIIIHKHIYVPAHPMQQFH